MRHEALLGMTPDEIDRYAGVLGIDLGNAETKREKIAIIEGRRERVADVRVLGMTLAVPIRNLHDARVAEALRVRPLTDEMASRVMTLVLGEEQYDALIEHCTDDDGVIDADAVGLAFVLLFEDPELKNF